MPELNNAKFAFDNAIKLLNDNNLKESVEQLNEIIKIEPNHIKSLNLLGDIYIKLNKPKESLHFVNKVLNIEKFNKLNLEKKYKLLLFLGNESSSHETLELLHKKHPSINTARELSNYYLKIDDEEKSDKLEDYQTTFNDEMKTLNTLTQNYEKSSLDFFKYQQTPNIYGILGIGFIVVGVILLNTLGKLKS